MRAMGARKCCCYSLVVIALLYHLISSVSSQNLNFTYNAFLTANLTLDGIASVTPGGLLRLTNETRQEMGHAFHPTPVPFKNTTTQNATVSSFSTTFVFGIMPQYSNLGGHGIAFVISPTRGLPGSLPSGYLGLFNDSNRGNPNNRVVAVEFDTIYNSEFGDINDNHVGIDVNGLDSEAAVAAGYYNAGEMRELTLISGQPIQAWVEYDGIEKRINVTLAPIHVPKPSVPVLSLALDLSPIFNKVMYVGFSSSTGSMLTSHYILGWSFQMNGQAQPLALSQLPSLPRIETGERSKLFPIGLPLISVSLVLAAVSALVYFIRRRKKFAEVLEEWELEYGPHRFKFRDLYIATKGFRDKELLGSGGFGSVYKGVLPTSKLEIAVKRVSHESRQGMREFVAEIVSLGRLRHRNLVTLLGYCRRKGELLLVYDYMPRGSLDKYLYHDDQPEETLTWSQRFKVIKGVASGLFYLHEEWDQIVIHRDVKASNVLLDEELNSKLGDFGLARLYEHGTTDPRTTHVVGTLGYLAPEHARTGKATTSTDVFSFGAFLLEVASGRRPVEPEKPAEEVVLVDWVHSCWVKGGILEAMDSKLGAEFAAEEVELVLKLGLLCSNSDPGTRPSMRQVVQILEGDLSLPQISPALGFINATGGIGDDGFSDFAVSYPSSGRLSSSSSAADSLLYVSR